MPRQPKARVVVSRASKVPRPLLQSAPPESLAQLHRCSSGSVEQRTLEGAGSGSACLRALCASERQRLIAATAAPALSFARCLRAVLAANDVMCLQEKSRPMCRQPPGSRLLRAAQTLSRRWLSTHQKQSKEGTQKQTQTPSRKPKKLKL